MARTKGSTNKNPPAAPDSFEYTTEERLEFIASLIVDRVLEDVEADQPLLKAIGANNVR